MKRTISGDIRRIRKLLKPAATEGFVTAPYGELHKLFDEIEAKEKSYEKALSDMCRRLLVLKIFDWPKMTGDECREIIMDLEKDIESIHKKHNIEY